MSSETGGAVVQRAAVVPLAGCVARARVQRHVHVAARDVRLNKVLLEMIGTCSSCKNTPIQMTHIHIQLFLYIDIFGLVFSN